MTIPHRGKTGDSTYFISAQTYLKKNILQSDRMARLLIDVLYNYRKQNKYFLHEFVVMPNHFHLLITPASETTLERALQLIKGGFSFRANKELEFTGGDLARPVFMTEGCGMNRHILDSGSTSTKIQYRQDWLLLLNSMSTLLRVCSIH